MIWTLHHRHQDMPDILVVAEEAAEAVGVGVCELAKHTRCIEAGEVLSGNAVEVVVAGHDPRVP